MRLEQSESGICRACGKYQARLPVGDMSTGGTRSIRRSEQALRRAGAAARKMLVAAAEGSGMCPGRNAGRATGDHPSSEKTNGEVCRQILIGEGLMQEGDSSKHSPLIALIAVSLALTSPLSAADAPPSALSCSGCHSTNRGADTTVSRLAGRNPAAIVAAMEGFKSGQLASTVMGRIAKGFSENEIKAIADWYGEQKD
jgi:sulfide dehydrogenase cytochrome subunit